MDAKVIFDTADCSMKIRIYAENDSDYLLLKHMEYWTGVFTPSQDKDGVLESQKFTVEHRGA